MSFRSLLVHTADVQSRTLTTDGGGSYTESWAAAFEDVPCRIVPISAQELQARGTTVEQISHKMFMGHSIAGTETAIAVDDRVSFDSRTFQVRGVLNVDELDRMLAVDLLEIN